MGAPLRAERIKPKAEFTAVERAVRPSSAVVAAACAERDVLPPSDAELRADGATPGTQLHQLTLSYSFEMAPGTGDKPQPVLPRVQALHSQLYDSPLDSLLWRRRWS